MTILIICTENSFQTAQDHAAQVAKLQVAKDEADARQTQMKEEMKEEMERLKTQFIFKVQLFTNLVISVVLTFSPIATRIRNIHAQTSVVRSFEEDSE